MLNATTTSIAWYDAIDWRQPFYCLGRSINLRAIWLVLGHHLGQMIEPWLITRSELRMLQSIRGLRRRMWDRCQFEKQLDCDSCRSTWSISVLRTTRTTSLTVANGDLWTTVVVKMTFALSRISSSDQLGSISRTFLHRHLCNEFDHRRRQLAAHKL